MLEMRPNCETCDVDLGPDATNAFICSFECTYCQDCVQGVHGGQCPNCQGNLMPRPTRTGAMILKYPASLKRVLKT